jgi:hypothetical protein
VVEVAVGDEDRVELVDLLEVLRDLGVVGQPGVYDDLLAPGRYEPESGVPQVGDPGPSKHLVHGLPPPFARNVIVRGAPDL